MEEQKGQGRDKVGFGWMDVVDLGPRMDGMCNDQGLQVVIQHVDFLADGWVHGVGTVSVGSRSKTRPLKFLILDDIYYYLFACLLGV